MSQFGQAQKQSTKSAPQSGTGCFGAQRPVKNTSHENPFCINQQPTGSIFGASASIFGGASQPVTFGGQSQPLSFGGAAQPVTFGGQSQPLSFGGAAQPVPYGGVTQPVSFGGAAQPVSFGGTVQSVPYGGQSQPLSFGGATQPLSFGGATQPLSFGGATQPVPYGGATQPLSFGGATQPVPYGGQSQPLSFGGVTQPVPYGGQSQPLSFGGETQPLLFGGASQPVPYGGQSQPLSLGNQSQFGFKFGAQTPSVPGFGTQQYPSAISFQSQPGVGSDQYPNVAIQRIDDNQTNASISYQSICDNPYGTLPDFSSLLKDNKTTSFENTPAPQKDQSDYVPIRYPYSMRHQMSHVNRRRAFATELTESKPLEDPHIFFKPYDSIKRLVIEPIQPVGGLMTPVIIEDSPKQSHPPKLERVEYHTNPTMSQLCSMSDDQLSQVNGFSIIRDGYGRVDFCDQVTLTGLDLDQLVNITQGEVQIYDDNKSPPLGTGLNHPAIVTLYNCLPKREGSSLARYKTKIEKQTVAMGAELISYDMIEGNWVFKVSHW